LQLYVKNIGESLLYYFPVYTKPTDSIVSSVRCNLDIIQQRNDLNKALKGEGLPEISYRISSDFRKVFVAQSSLFLINDVFGPTVNMCAKINHM